MEDFENSEVANCNNELLDLELQLTEEQKKDVMKLAAIGVSPRDMTGQMQLNQDKATRFVALAAIAGSTVEKLIRTGRVNGRVNPQLKLHDAVNAGNMQALQQLQKWQNAKLYDELVKNMDNDELAL